MSQFDVWSCRLPDATHATLAERAVRLTFAASVRDPVAIAPPEGETLHCLSRRVRTFVTSLVRRYPGRTLALVTHAGPIRVLLNPDLKSFWNRDVPTGSRLEVVWNKARLESFQPERRRVAE